MENGSKELAEIRGKFNEQQKALEAERTAWINDKKTLEDTNVDLSTSGKQTESDRNSREQELSALEERAKVSFKVFYSFRILRTNPLQGAEQRYSQEIIAHAESMKTLDGLKKDLAAARASARGLQTAAETAEAKFTSSEGGWRQQKDALDKEITDLNAW